MMQRTTDQRIETERAAIEELVRNNKTYLDRRYICTYDYVFFENIKPSEVIKNIIDYVDADAKLDEQEKIALADSLKAVRESLHATMVTIHSLTAENLTEQNKKLVKLQCIANKNTTDGRPSQSGKMLGGAMMALGAALIVIGLTGAVLSVFFGAPTLGILATLPVAASLGVYAAGVAVAKVGHVHFSASCAHGLSKNLSLFAYAAKEAVDEVNVSIARKKMVAYG